MLTHKGMDFDMLKLNKKKYLIILLIIVSTILAIPFVNGFGCNASFIILNPRLGSLYGRCEYGLVTMSVTHEITKESYTQQGIMGYWRGRYFMLVTQRDIIPDSKNSESQRALRAFYYRSVYSGNIIGDEFKYVIYTTPEPTISRIFLNGYFGFLN
ncbi:hypothetical protein EC843_102400 [Buttiauxella sp. JUb87]|nr:hypothetical protein EC843_102400 [Buttiauxella sp. JUb87]